MKQIIYIIAITLLVIAAPIAALALSTYTFFITLIAFIQGAHQGIMNNLHGENTKEIEEEPKDIWEKHIKKMADKAKLN
jgi:hypothetical protein